MNEYQIKPAPFRMVWSNYCYGSQQEKGGNSSRHVLENFDFRIIAEYILFLIFLSKDCEFLQSIDLLIF